LVIINSVEGVKDPHNLKTRKVGNNIAIDIHIRVNPELTVSNSHVIATQIETLIKKSYGEESFITVHIEPDNA
ncbi:MAG TPA: cation transporter dimerization domain-containing protein, partial [Spirochaetota bacterium]|nr:cation transporter dimerization domain-containing protein [Spirochaetota bacterium]